MKNSSANFRIAASLVLLAMLVGVAFIGYLPQLGSRFASADAGVVQEQPGSCDSSGCSVVISLSGVTSGDVLVVVVADNSLLGSPSVTDTLSSSYTDQIFYATAAGPLAIFTTTLGSSGADKITISDSKTSQMYADVFEVSGVTTLSSQTGAGVSESCTSSGDCDMSTSTSVPFVSGAFLVSVFDCSCNFNSFTAGTGFTADTLLTSTYYDQYSTSGASSPTNFPAIGNIGDLEGGTWYEAALALEPLATTTVTSPTTTTSTTTSTTTASVTSTTTVTSVTTSTTTSTSTIFVLPTSTHLDCDPDRVHVGKSVDCTAIVKSSTLPGGTISFGWSEGKIGVLAPPVACTPIPSTTKCSASISFSFPKTGNAVVTAAYSGDLTHQSSHGADLVRVTW